MFRKIAFWLLWVGFIAYALIFAPTGGKDNLQLLINLFTLKWTEINGITLSIFALVGIWLMIYSCVLFFDGRMQELPFWIFAIASVATGVIGLLPYLALREQNEHFSGSKNQFLQILDSRLTALYIITIVVALATYTIIAGDWADFVEQFLSLRFVNVMTVAVGLFWLCFPSIVGDDLARRGMKKGQILTGITFIPLVGALAYLFLRPQLEADQLD